MNLKNIKHKKKYKFLIVNNLNTLSYAYLIRINMMKTIIRKINLFKILNIQQNKPKN